MIKISLIIINVTLIVFLYFLNIWFEEENFQIQKLNQKYIADMHKLKDISEINSWLDTKVKKNLNELPKDDSSADLKLIEFFDSHAKTYSFKVKKFIYKDNLAHFLTIQYTISRENYNLLKKFVKQQYKDGYILLKKFKITKSTLSGELTLVQPYPFYKIEKNKEAVDNVPQ